MLTTYRQLISSTVDVLSHILQADGDGLALLVWKMGG
jgi:hypothetical protein